MVLVVVACRHGDFFQKEMNSADEDDMKLWEVVLSRIRVVPESTSEKVVEIADKACVAREPLAGYKDEKLQVVIIL